jgi:hypothetical protein
MVVMTVRMGILRCDFAQCERSEENKKREGIVLPVSKLLVVPRVRECLPDYSLEHSNCKTIPPNLKYTAGKAILQSIAHSYGFVKIVSPRPVRG